MKRGRFTAEQIIAVLREHEAWGKTGGADAQAISTSSVLNI